MDELVEMYQKMYTIIFNAVSDALKEMDNLNYGLARTILESAQGETEDIYICWPERESEGEPISDLSPEERAERCKQMDVMERAKALREHCRMLDQQRGEWETELRRLCSEM